MGWNGCGSPLVSILCITPNKNIHTTPYYWLDSLTLATNTCKEMYRALLEFPERWEVGLKKKNPFHGGGIGISETAHFWKK